MTRSNYFRSHTIKAKMQLEVEYFLSIDNDKYKRINKERIGFF